MYRYYGTTTAPASTFHGSTTTATTTTTTTTNTTTLVPMHRHCYCLRSSPFFWHWHPWCDQKLSHHWCHSERTSENSSWTFDIWVSFLTCAGMTVHMNVTMNVILLIVVIMMVILIVIFHIIYISFKIYNTQSISSNN